MFALGVDGFHIELWPSFLMANSLAGLESPLQMSGMSSPVTSVGGSKSSSLRRRKRPGRHATERQTSMEKHNGEVSTSTSGKI